MFSHHSAGHKGHRGSNKDHSYSGAEYVKGAPLTDNERAVINQERSCEEYRNDF